MNNCLTCKFWETTETFWSKNEYTNGTCHRFPPTVVFDTQIRKAITINPEVDGGDWCGEFFKKEE